MQILDKFTIHLQEYLHFFFVFENFAQVLRQKIITTYTENSSEIYVTC